MARIEQYPTIWMGIGIFERLYSDKKIEEYFEILDQLPNKKVFILSESIIFGPILKFTLKFTNLIIKTFPKFISIKNAKASERVFLFILVSERTHRENIILVIVIYAADLHKQGEQRQSNDENFSTMQHDLVIFLFKKYFKLSFIEINKKMGKIKKKAN